MMAMIKSSFQQWPYARVRNKSSELPKLSLVSPLDSPSKASTSTLTSIPSSPIAPDGYLHVEYNDGTFEEYPFAMMDHWNIVWNCIRIKFNHRETLWIPLASIFRFNVITNSDEFVESKRSSPIEDQANCRNCGGRLWQST